MEAVMKCVYELSKLGKLIYKAALKGKELSIIACMHMFNSVAVISSSVNIITTTTKAPNIVKKDKEEHSYIIVSSDVELTSKDIYLDYKSTSKDLDQDIEEDIKEDIEEKVCSLAIVTVGKLTLSKIKTITLAEKDSIRKRLFTDSGRNIDNISGVMLGTCHNLKGRKRKR